LPHKWPLTVDLQWSLNLDLKLAMNRLDETFNHDGMVHPATKCGMAYCSLRLVARASGHDPHRIGWWGKEKEHAPDLQNVIEIYRDWPDVFNGSATSRVTKWALSTIPLKLKQHFKGSLQKTVEYFLNQFTPENMQTLDEEDVCNYLCCLNTFFSHCNPRILIQMSKK
ncbi:hypothetical protein GGX14DRAFT_458510, partial [Mycena pura]